MSENSIRLIIVEDENLLRDLLTNTLARVSNISIVGTYENGKKALDDVERAKPDVALLDIDLGPGWTGVETGLHLRQCNPSMGIVLLSNYASPDLLQTIPATEVGGWSYLLKKSSHNLHSFTRAIEGARARLVVLDPELLLKAYQEKQHPFNQLTTRQLEILTLVSQGYTNAAIAKSLFLSEKSIENQLTAIYAALNISSGNSQEHARVKAVLAFLGQSSV